MDGLVFIPLGIADRYMNVPERDHASLILWLIFSNSAVWMYSVFMHAGFGQTIGKMVTHVKVFDVSEQRIPSLWQALLRDVGNIFVGSASLAYSIYFVSTNSYFVDDRFRRDTRADDSRRGIDLVLARSGDDVYERQAPRVSRLHRRYSCR